MQPSAESVIDLLECPYNPAHQLLPHTMARHISKCRRAHGILKLVQCPFNPEHRVPELEMTLHKLECEDRAAFEQYTFCFTTLSSPSTNANVATTKSPATPTTMRTRKWAKEMADLSGSYCTSPKAVPAASRRRTIGGMVPAPVTPLPAPEQTLHRVYDLRTSCRQSRKDSNRSPGHVVASPSAIEAVKTLPLIATVSPLRSGKPRYAVEHLQCDKENHGTIPPKTPKPSHVQKFRTPVKISQRKLSIDDFRKHWKQVHNERRAQSRSKDRSARRSCYT